MKHRKTSVARLVLRLTRWIAHSIAWIVLALVLCAAAAVMGLRSIVTPDALKALVIARLEATFRRPVRVQHVTFLLQQGIKLSGLEVQESDAFPGGTFLSSDFLLAKYRFSALLRGRLELDEVLLMAPRIRLVRRGDGVWNLQEAIRGPGEPGRGGLKLQPVASADVLTVERGTVELEDRLRGVSATLRDVNLRVTNLNWDAPFGFRLGFSGEGKLGGRSLDVKGVLEGQAALEGLRPGGGWVEAKRLRLEAGGQALELTGTLRDFRAPSVELKADVPPLDTAALAKFCAAPPGIRVPALRVQAKLGIPRVSTAALSGVKSPAGDREWRIERLSASGEGLSLSSGGRLDPATRRLRLWWTLPATSIERLTGLYAPWAQRKPSGLVSGSGTLAGELAKPELESLQLKGQGFSLETGRGKRLGGASVEMTGTDRMRTVDVRVAGGTFVAYGNALSKLDLDMRLRGGDALFRRLEWTWNESRFRLRGCVRDIADVDKVYVDGDVDKLRVDEFYRAILNIIAQRKAEKGEGPDTRPWSQVFKYAIPERFPNMTGRLHVDQAYSPNFDSQNVEVRWELNDISRGLSSVSGSFRVGFGPATVNNAHEVRKEHPVLNVLIMPFSFMQEMEAKARASFDTAVLKTLTINRTYGDFSVQQGVVDVRYVHFDSPQFVAYTDGRVDFPQEKLELHVLMREAKPRGQLPFTMMDTEGRPALDLIIKDDLNRPTVELSHHKMGGSDIEDAVAAGAKRGIPLADIASKLTCGVKP